MASHTVAAESCVCPIIKHRFTLTARYCKHVVTKCTDVACPGIGNLEPCQQNRHHDQNGREGNGKLGANRTPLIEHRGVTWGG